MPKKNKPSKKPSPKKKPAKKQEKPEKPKISADEFMPSPEARKIWLRIRKAYNMSYSAFSNTMGLLNDKEANMIYDIVKHSLYKDNVAEIVRKTPAMKEFVKNDDDRLCMHDVYELLSWRLRRREEPPKDRKVIADFRKAVKGEEIP